MENKDQAAPAYPGNIEDPPVHPLEELITILMRGKWMILATFGIVFAATALYTFLSKPDYEATSMVLIDSKGRGGTLPFLDITGAATTSKITNELETLKARSTAEAVAQALLDKTFLDASKQQFIPIIRKVVDGNPEDAKDNLAAVTNRLVKVVDFTPVKESDIIRITVRTHDSVEVALLADIYAKVYTERNMSASRIKSRAIREFLQSQMGAKHEALDSTEHNLQAYMRTSGMVSLDAEADKVVKQLSQLEATRDGIGVEISSRMKTLNSYRQELAIQEPNVAKAIGESNDAYIKLIQEQMAKLEVQRDVVIAQNPELSGEKIYSEKLKEIDSQIASLRKNLEARTATFLGTLIPGDRTNGAEGGTTGFLSQVKQRIIEQQIELDGLVARKGALNSVVAEYERQFNQIPGKSIELAKLQRARLSSEKLYLLVEEKFNEAAITETSEFGYVNIMDPPVVPTEPVSPKVMSNLMLGAMLGFFLGLGIVVVRARMDDRIQSPEDMKKHGVTPLATIGTIGPENRRNGKTGSAHSTGTSGLHHHLVAFFSPLSSMSEGYRQLRTSVQYSQPDKPTRTVIVSSASPKEGKSTTVCNLAISFAQGENRVLLVDADMRRPTVHALFGLVGEPGLTDVVFGKRVFEDVVHGKVLENLDVLCCGTIPPNPAEVLNSRRMREFIEHVRAAYDVVLFDSPPLLAVMDAAILSRLVDAIVLVACAGRTGLTTLDRVAEIFHSVNKSATGVVLNNFDMRKAYGGYYGRHRRDHYSYGYGYTA